MAVALPSQLQVIGTRSVYRFFLPPAGELFISSEFRRISRDLADLEFDKVPRSGALTVVVNPDDYTVDCINSLEGPVCLWFLRRMAADEKDLSLSAPRLLQIARADLAARRRFLHSLRPDHSRTVVVSDLETRDYCISVGFETFLSPPPVNDKISGENFVTHRGFTLDVPAETNSYSKEFLGALPAGIYRQAFDGQRSREQTVISTHALVVDESILRGFPYEAAVALARGQTLISEPLCPRWGLEPGIDYVEFATPEELRTVVEYCARNPSATRLMSTRGLMKSVLFSSTQVFLRLSAAVV